MPETIIRLGEAAAVLDEFLKELLQSYHSNVLRDFDELHYYYPFSTLKILPTAVPSLATITVVAVNRDIINMVNGRPGDFTGGFSKQLFLELPWFYWITGCRVYGCKWLNTNKFKYEDLHLLQRDNCFVVNQYGYKLCVGAPASFKSMKNVVLEAVRTAENMLVAYERVQSGVSDQFILNAYSHGDKGKQEYRYDRKKYISV